MFTGLVEETGTITRLVRLGEGGRLSVRARTVVEGTRVGDSIAVSGACLTVVEVQSGGFVVDCMPETLTRTTLGGLAPGSAVNLERSLALGGRLGGHFVLGHVDAVGEILDVRTAANAWEVRVSLPELVRSSVAAKGSIAIDGISLTVTEVATDSFAVGIIPHTLRETTLRGAKTGQRVNLEADVLARYVMRVLQVEGETHGGRETGGMTLEWLQEQGFA